ncbi:MAG: arsenite methyltransferase [Planctomycetota bacterium]|nr:arsenite methyltransferase [Planctomycetota bacterium]
MNEPTNPSSSLPNDAIRATVRDRYGKIPAAAANSCCAPSTGCCGSSAPADQMAQDLGYTASDTSSVPEGSNLGLGCGNPTGIASLQPGQTVLDLGSGAGFDAFLAAKQVGPTGHVIGVDMTPEMLQKARENQQRSGMHNVEFRLGEIEHLPLGDRSVDVILSNCVINLSPDKARVFAEAFRVCKPGGRLAISDIVALKPLPDSLRKDLELYTGCVAGAATIADLQAMLTAAGFVDVHIEPKANLRPVVDGWFPGRGVGDHVASANITSRKPA